MKEVQDSSLDFFFRIRHFSACHWSAVTHNQTLISVGMGRLIHAWFRVQRFSSGPTGVSSFDVTTFAVSRLWCNRDRQASPIDVSTPKFTMFCPTGKKKKLNMQFIIFMYKKYRAILLSGLKIGKAFKMRKWISHLCRPLSRKFYVTSSNDVYSKMTQYGTSTTFSFTAKKGFTKSRSGVRSREQR
jgi:hypothetical protein